MEYKFKYDEKEYTLNKENLLEIVNDEETPVKGFEIEEVLRLLNQGEAIEFAKAYYSSPCEECNENFKEKKSISEYLETFFYIYSKDENYVISNIDKEYEGKTFHRLEMMGEVDDSYIVTIIVCNNCGKFTVQIEELEI